MQRRGVQGVLRRVCAAGSDAMRSCVRPPHWRARAALHRTRCCTGALPPLSTSRPRAQCRTGSASPSAQARTAHTRQRTAHTCMQRQRHTQARERLSRCHAATPAAQPACQHSSGASTPASHAKAQQAAHRHGDVLQREALARLHGLALGVGLLCARERQRSCVSRRAAGSGACVRARVRACGAATHHRSSWPPPS